ncbi:hypothetical protein [Alcanivorax sp. 1008]|uniref:5' nucleotidase, NT5C type n=1 Tax=Alcanivorax sp. 1008 TaxID=2816853 RepID=UPI001E3DEB92
MKEELDELLFSRYPTILGQCRANGLAVDDGWFCLIDSLCAGLQDLTDKSGMPQVQAVQVKEKFGGLRFYAGGCDSLQSGMVLMAELLSSRTCEVCGAPAKRCVREVGWRTLCAAHEADEGWPRNRDKLLIFVDMDDVLTDFRGAFLKAREREPDNRWPQSKIGFFQNLEPLPDAIEAVHALDAMAGLDVHILTAPSPRNPHCYTEKRLWVEQHLGYRFVKRLHISADKGLFQGDILIDDNIKGKGQERFRGTVLQFGSNDYPDWPSVVAGVLSLTN